MGSYCKIWSQVVVRFARWCGLLFGEWHSQRWVRGCWMNQERANVGQSRPKGRRSSGGSPAGPEDHGVSRAGGRARGEARECSARPQQSTQQIVTGSLELQSSRPVVFTAWRAFCYVFAKDFYTTEVTSRRHTGMSDCILLPRCADGVGPSLGLEAGVRKDCEAGGNFRAEGWGRLLLLDSLA